MSEREIFATIEFDGEIVEWRGPAPFLFVPVPQEHVGEVRYAARQASYGWGVIPVTATLGPAKFTTSLFPRDGTYLLPLKLAVRRRVAVTVGDVIALRLRIGWD